MYSQCLLSTSKLLIFISGHIQPLLNSLTAHFSIQHVASAEHFTLQSLQFVSSLSGWRFEIVLPSSQRFGSEHIDCF